mmetsp:Transcript_105553/g.303566  ORF Transcript_105553/g.303566 Transcript_105553/m.303566 type:complete len:291 (+) Transcript_105553:223-1095(+)
MQDDHVHARHHCDDAHHRPTDLKELHKGYMIPGFFSNSRHDDIARRADQSSDAAQARTQRQRPDHGLQGHTLHLVRCRAEHRYHCRGKRDVVDERRSEGRDDLQHDDGTGLPRFNGDKLDQGDQGGCDLPQKAKLGNALGEHEEACEEQQRVPLHLANRIVEVMVVAHHQEQRGTEARAIGGVQMCHGVQKEHQQANAEHRSCLDEELGLLDRVLLLQHLNVYIDAQGEIFLPVIPAREAQADGHQDHHDGTQDKQEIHKVYLVAESVADNDVRRIPDHGSGAPDVAEER